MNGHDPLCRATYQRITDPLHCVQCDIIAAVREDDRHAYDINIGKLNAAYKRGFTDALEEAAILVEEYFKRNPSLAKVHVYEVIKRIRQI